MGTSSNVNITIPCGGKDPPYTYTRAGSSVVVENVSHFYTATKQNQFNNGEGYCCHGTGGTTCYQLNITCVLSYCCTWAFFISCTINICSLQIHHAYK